MKAIPIDNLLGVDNRVINTVYWQSGDSPSSRLVCVLPGYSYPTEAPATFYLKLLFLDAGYDWLAVDYRYNENAAYAALSGSDKSDYFAREQKAIADFLSAQYTPDELILLGKSIGSAAVHQILNNLRLGSPAPKINVLLLTPIDSCYDMHLTIEKHSITVLSIIGDQDPFFPGYMDSSLKASAQVKTEIIENSGHIFQDKDSNLPRSIANIQRVVDIVTEYLQL